MWRSSLSERVTVGILAIARGAPNRKGTTTAREDQIELCVTNCRAHMHCYGSWPHVRQNMRMHSWLVWGAVVHGCGTALHHGRPHWLTRRHEARAAAARWQARVGAPRPLLKWKSTQQGGLPGGCPAAATRRVTSKLPRSGLPRIAPPEQEAANVRDDPWGARRVR